MPQAARAGSSTTNQRSARTKIPSIMSAKTAGQGRSRTTTETIAEEPRRRIVLWTPTRLGGLRKVGTSRPFNRASCPRTRAASAKRIENGTAAGPDTTLVPDHCVIGVIFATTCDNPIDDCQFASRRTAVVRLAARPPAIIGRWTITFPRTPNH